MGRPGIAGGVPVAQLWGKLPYFWDSVKCLHPSNKGISAVISPAGHRPSETNMTPKMLVRRTLMAVLLLLLTSFGTSTAALAHDAVTGTSPADGSTVAAVPEKVEISMSNTPAVIGSQVLVLDESGADWAAGEVDVLDKIATQALKPGTPAGKYTVKWRLVSSDSHPVEGIFSFVATAAGAGSGAGAGPMVSVAPQPATAAEPVQDDSAVPWSVIGLMVVLVGVVVAMVVVARRRLIRED